MAAGGIDCGQAVLRGNPDDQLAMHEHARPWRSDQTAIRLAGECMRARLISSASWESIGRGSTPSEGATDWILPNSATWEAIAASRSTATRVTCGATSLSNSSHLPAKPNSGEANPVVLPPGRAK